MIIESAVVLSNRAFMADSSRKRKHPDVVISVSREGDTDTDTTEELRNRNITLSRQGRRLTQLSTPISAGTSAQVQKDKDPPPWDSEFYDDVNVETHDDPPLPIIDEDVVSHPFLRCNRN